MKTFHGVAVLFVAVALVGCSAVSGVVREMSTKSPNESAKGFLKGAEKTWGDAKKELLENVNPKREILIPHAPPTSTFPFSYERAARAPQKPVGAPSSAPSAKPEAMKQELTGDFEVVWAYQGWIKSRYPAPVWIQKVRWGEKTPEETFELNPGQGRRIYLHSGHVLHVYPIHMNGKELIKTIFPPKK